MLAYAAEEAERLGHKHIGTEHLLLGLLREEKCFAAEMLKERGVRLLMIREELAKAATSDGSTRPGGIHVARRPFTDLIQAATDGQLEPMVGRDLELESIVEILCSRHNKNPLLIGNAARERTQSSRVWRSASQRERFHHYWQTSGSWPRSRDLSPAGRMIDRNSKS